MRLASWLHRGSSLFVGSLLPATAAIWAGCTDDLSGDPIPEAGPPDAATTDTSPAVDTGIDAGPVKRNCALDEDADGLFEHLDCTGLYADFATKTIAGENMPYRPGVEFWSDGAVKSRWLFLPAAGKIDITSFDEWKFPNETKVWKEFVVDGKRIETRLYWKTKDAWRHTTYRWNDDETDAVRKDSSEVIARPGKAPYEIPGTSQCGVCHSGHEEPLLGVEAVSLGIASATGVTLATLAAEGRFATTPPATSLTIPNDVSGAAAPALAWLHANCGHCHNKGPTAAAAFTQLFFLLKPSQLIPDGGTPTIESLDAFTTAVNQNSNKLDEDAGVPFIRIVPGNPGASLVSILSGRRVAPGADPNTTQMPPIVTRTVDTAGHALLDAWITSIP